MLNRQNASPPYGISSFIVMITAEASAQIGEIRIYCGSWVVITIPFAVLWKVILLNALPSYIYVAEKNVPSELYFTTALDPSFAAGILTPLTRRVSPASRWIKLAASMFAPMVAQPVLPLLLPLEVLRRVFAEMPMVSMRLTISASYFEVVAVIIISPVTSGMEIIPSL